MCGICGIVAPKTDRNIQALAAMIEVQHHRGPDAHDSYWFSKVGLGHNRLAIVDLSPQGAQPMLSADKSMAITFNGEIYGYKDVKKKFYDYSFKSTSDTEVILAAYQKYGPKMLDFLPGMFALAIWNEAEQSLFACRDRMGEKPFYYAIGPKNEFIFASEIKSILATGLVKPVLDQTMLSHYLNHLYVDPSRSIYKNIYVLPPAHYLIFEKNKVKIKSYWQLPQNTLSISFPEAVAEFKSLLTQSVKKQLVADVTVGAFLSGGLDSSSIVALASQFVPKLNTYSFGFSGEESELPFALEVSQRYQTNHTVLEDTLDLSVLLHEMQQIYDEPFADSSCIPTYLISKQARKHTTVVLSGDGGDELCGGYAHWYRPLYWMKSAPQFMSDNSLVKQTALLMLRIKHRYARELLYFQQGLVLRKTSADLIIAHQNQNSYFSSDELMSLHLTDQNLNARNNDNTETDLAAVFKEDVSNYMLGDVLVKTDRASMAHALELRTPFLDYKLVEFCLSLPTNFKLTASQDKYVLRKAFEQDLPKSVLRRPKQGFGAPVSKWLHRQDAEDLLAEYLDNQNKKIFSLIPYKAVQKYRTLHNYQTWSLLNLSIWLESRNFPIA